MFTDSHSHIHLAREFPDIGGVMERAESAGVTRQVIVGCTPKDSYQALQFVKKHESHKFWSTLGIHPHNANECNDKVLARFREIAKAEKKIVALGELGLDFYRNLQPKDVQKKAYKDQLVLARELDLAVVVHVRDAWEDALSILAETGNTKVIMHCFTGDMRNAEECWKRGYYTSFSGIITYPKNDELRLIAEEAPADMILIETDCPYLSPQLYRGKRNEPAFVVETAKELAKIRSYGLEELAEITTGNAKTIFGIS